MAGFNPRSIRDTEVAEVSITDPETKSATGAFITIAGPEHPIAKKIRFQTERRVRKDMEKAGRLVLSDPEADAQREIDELVDITLGWRGFANDDGSEMPFTPEAVRALYLELSWLRAQITDARRDRALFIKRSAAN